MLAACVDTGQQKSDQCCSMLHDNLLNSAVRIHDLCLECSLWISKPHTRMTKARSPWLRVGALASSQYSRGLDNSIGVWVVDIYLLDSVPSAPWSGCFQRLFKPPVSQHYPIDSVTKASISGYMLRPAIIYHMADLGNRQCKRTMRMARSCLFWLASRLTLPNCEITITPSIGSAKSLENRYTSGLTSICHLSWLSA